MSGLHRFHSVLPGRPARGRILHDLPVRQPCHRLEVVSIRQGIDLSLVHAHLLELVQAARVVEVHMRPDGQKRIFPLCVFSQQAVSADVVGQAAEAETGVDQHVLRSMAGKGRGIAAFTFNVEALGLTRGSMPETQQGPKPLFPQIEFKPVPLKAGEDEDYMLALKQEIRGRMKDLPFNIKPGSGRSDVERYKEKYIRECQKIEDEEWTPDWNRLPKELMPQKKRIKRKTDPKKPRKVSSKEQEALLSKLDELEKKGDKSDDENEKKEEKKEKKGNEEEEEVEADEYDEEELEEENDYIDTYFEDGDEFGAGSDENMDEATY